jgi:hypothetical protein
MARTFVYIPRPRRLGWLVDLAVVAATLACIVHFSWRRLVDCRWDKLRASCDVAYVDPLGRQTHESIAGIRGSAYRSHAVVGLVTDARNKGEHALFGTHEVLLDTTDAAERLEAFASDREPDRIALETGAHSPLLVTIGLLAALLVYAIVTRSRTLRVEVDERDNVLTVRGAERARYAIDTIESVSVEGRGRGQRVVLRLRSGEARPLTDGFSKGAHHQALAAQLAAALGVSIG